MLTTKTLNQPHFFGAKMINTVDSATLQHSHHRSQSHSLVHLSSKIYPFKQSGFFSQKRPKSLPILPSQHTPTMSSGGPAPRRKADRPEVRRLKQINRNFTIYYEHDKINLGILLPTQAAKPAQNVSKEELTKIVNDRANDVFERHVELGSSQSWKQHEIHETMQKLYQRRKESKQRQAAERKSMQDCLVLIDEIVDEMYSHFGSDSEGEQ